MKILKKILKWIAIAVISATFMDGCSKLDYYSMKRDVDGDPRTYVARDIKSKYPYGSCKDWEIIDVVDMKQYYNYFLYLHMKTLPNGWTYDDLCYLYRNTFSNDKLSHKEKWATIATHDKFLRDSIGYTNHIYITNIYKVTYTVTTKVVKSTPANAFPLTMHIRSSRWIGSSMTYSLS